MPLLFQDSIKICYETFGNPANSPLILISGLTSQLINWPQEIVQGLVSEGFYVITFDNRDVGLSSYYDHLATPSLSEVIALKQQASHFAPPYQLEEMAQDVIILMDALKVERAHMVGMSMGGQIAQLLAIHYPQRCLSLSCVATSSGNPNLAPPHSSVIELMSAPAAVVKDLESYLTLRLQSYKIYNHPEDVNEDEARQFLSAAFRRAYHPEGNTRQLLAIMAAPSRSEALKKLRLPTLVFHGDYDPVFPLEHAEELAQLIAHSRLYIVEKLGHGLPERIRSTLVKAIAALR